MVRTLTAILLPSAPGAFRLWLALAVVIHHVTGVEIGKFPVLVFFALSGYWVYRVWTARYVNAARPWLTFVISRWWRLAPAMTIAAALCTGALAITYRALFGAVLLAPLGQALSSVFVLGYAQLPVRPVGPAWSLDVEMQFYLAAPLLILFVRRVSPIVALSLAFILCAGFIAVYPEVVLTSFLPPFVLGMVAARHEWSVPHRLASMGQALAIVLIVLALASPWREILLGAAEGSWWPQVNILLAALCLPQALVSVRCKSGPRDQLCADHSYLVYLLHWPAILVLRWATAWGERDYLAILALLSVSTVLLCWGVHRWIDGPLGRARTRWVAARLGEQETGMTMPANSPNGPASISAT